MEITAEHITEKILEAAKGKELPCAMAFDLARRLSITPAEVGRHADGVEVHLTKCQLGLFGHRPDKKIVKPADAVAPELEVEISKALVNDRLPCAAAWRLSERFNIGKMAVSAACEHLGVKIKPCQLGAF